MPKLKTLKPRIAELSGRTVARIDASLYGDRKLSPSKRGYTRQWQEQSKLFLRAHPLCQCRQCGVLSSGRLLSQVVDHVIPHRGNMSLFWDTLNWQALAKQCHDKKTYFETLGDGIEQREFEERRMPAELAPSRIPCVMVCGPPNGGKHPYVREHAGANDVVIDLDQIQADLSGLPAWESGITWLDQSLDERNRQLRALATDTTHAWAWFLINAPNPRERALWARRLGAQVILLAPPLAECVRRIKAEQYHAGYTEQMIDAARRWWDQNT